MSAGKTDNPRIPCGFPGSLVRKFIEDFKTVSNVVLMCSVVSCNSCDGAN